MAKPSGFTLLELIVTVAIIGILSAVALPSLTNMIRNNRATAEATTVLTLLTLARGEAIKRNTTTVVCKSTDGKACSTTASVTWDKGAIVFIDDGAGTAAKAGNQVIDTNEVIVRYDYPLSTSSTITGDTAIANFVQYGSDGRILYKVATPPDTSTFTIVPPGKTTASRKVEINATGRPRVLVCTSAGVC